jgi:hypothetical protein
MRPPIQVVISGSEHWAEARNTNSHLADDWNICVARMLTKLLHMCICVYMSHSWDWTGRTNRGMRVGRAVKYWHRLCLDNPYIVIIYLRSQIDSHETGNWMYRIKEGTLVNGPKAKPTEFVVGPWLKADEMMLRGRTSFLEYRGCHK